MRERCSGRMCSVNLPGKRHQVVERDRSGNDDAHGIRKGICRRSASTSRAWRRESRRGRVMMADASARAHSQSRAIGNWPTAWAITCCAIEALAVRLAMIISTVTESWSGMPAIVVGHERERRVADLRFTRELGLLQVRHPDDVEAGRPVRIRLGHRRKLRPFHAHVGAAFVDGRSGLGPPRVQDAAERTAERMREADVRHEAVAEECADPPARAVVELVGDHEILRLAAPRAGCRPRSPTESTRRRAS